jgi:hypothetical protein
MRFFRKISSRLRTIALLFDFLWKRRLYWLIPLLIVVLMLAVVIILAQLAGIAPFLYPIV